MDSAQFIPIHGNLTELNLTLRNLSESGKKFKYFQTYKAEAEC